MIDRPQRAALMRPTIAGVRVVTWNLGYWTPSAVYNTLDNRKRAWRFLLSLDADVILVQESRPDDLAAVEKAESEYTVVGTIPARWRACSAVIAKKSLNPLATPRSGNWLGFLSGYVALATLTTPVGNVLVASVHTPAKVAEEPALCEDDHQLLRRAGCERAWYNDVAFGALDSLPEKAGFIFGGDWNTARLFDTIYPDGADGEAGASTQFFTRAAEHGWCESLRKFHPNEVRTYLKPGTQPYELDHVFTDAASHQRLTACEVIAGLPASEISDHAPVLLDFADAM